MTPTAPLQAESPILFEYFGLELFLNSSDNRPIHIYARTADSMSMASIHFLNGIYSSAELRNVPDVAMLDDKEIRHFRTLIEQNLSQIVNSWIDFYVFNRQPVSERILKPVDR
jgi:hypothetical protein